MSKHANDPDTNEDNTDLSTSEQGAALGQKRLRKKTRASMMTGGLTLQDTLLGNEDERRNARRGDERASVGDERQRLAGRGASGIDREAQRPAVQEETTDDAGMSLSSDVGGKRGHTLLVTDAAMTHGNDGHGRAQRRRTGRDEQKTNDNGEDSEDGAVADLVAERTQTTQTARMSLSSDDPTGRDSEGARAAHTGDDGGEPDTESAADEDNEEYYDARCDMDTDDETEEGFWPALLRTEVTQYLDGSRFDGIWTELGKVYLATPGAHEPGSATKDEGKTKGKRPATKQAPKRDERTVGVTADRQQGKQSGKGETGPGARGKGKQKAAGAVESSSETKRRAEGGDEHDVGDEETRDEEENYANHGDSLALGAEHTKDKRMKTLEAWRRGDRTNVAEDGWAPRNETGRWTELTEQTLDYLTEWVAGDLEGATTPLQEWVIRAWVDSDTIQKQLKRKSKNAGVKPAQLFWAAVALGIERSQIHPGVMKGEISERSIRYEAEWRRPLQRQPALFTVGETHDDTGDDEAVHKESGIGEMDAIKLMAAVAIRGPEWRAPATRILRRSKAALDAACRTTSGGEKAPFTMMQAKTFILARIAAGQIWAADFIPKDGSKGLDAYSERNATVGSGLRPEQIEVLRRMRDGATPRGNTATDYQTVGSMLSTDGVGVATGSHMHQKYNAALVIFGWTPSQDENPAPGRADEARHAEGGAGTSGTTSNWACCAVWSAHRYGIKIITVSDENSEVGGCFHLCTIDRGERRGAEDIARSIREMASGLTMEVVHRSMEDDDVRTDNAQLWETIRLLYQKGKKDTIVTVIMRSDHLRYEAEEARTRLRQRERMRRAKSASAASRADREDEESVENTSSLYFWLMVQIGEVDRAKGGKQHIDEWRHKMGQHVVRFYNEEQLKKGGSVLDTLACDALRRAHRLWKYIVIDSTALMHRCTRCLRCRAREAFYFGDEHPRSSKRRKGTEPVMSIGLCQTNCTQCGDAEGILKKAAAFMTNVFDEDVASRLRCCDEVGHECGQLTVPPTTPGGSGRHLWVIGGNRSMTASRVGRDAKFEDYKNRRRARHRGRAASQQMR